MSSSKMIIPTTLLLSLFLAGASAAEFFDDFSYTSGPADNPIDPLFQCFGWFVRSGDGGPGPVGATWRADYVHWASDLGVPGNRLMRLRASTNGTGAGTFQSEVDTDQDFFHEGTYAARVKFADLPVGVAQPSTQALTTYKGLLCDLNYSECDLEYTPLDPWSTRCGSLPALHLQTWEQYCDSPSLWDMTPSQPSPACGSLAGWHTLTITVSGGEVRYSVDGLVKAVHGGEYYPESPMRLLLLHWFHDRLNPGVSVDMAMEVDWVYYAKDAVLTRADVENAVAQLRSAGVVRRNTMVVFPDCNGNGISDQCEPDSDEDGIIDACDSTRTWRVKYSATGAGTGASWTDAFTSLQSALAVAQAGDEIWVAAGTYRPAPPNGSRSTPFRLASGAGIYGGFDGTELRRSQRDHRANPTVLSGDLNGNDGSGSASTSDNSYVVVDASATSTSTTLDGFTIKGAKGTYAGGLFMDGGDLKVSFCILVGNSAVFGGAVCIHESTPTFSRCYFGGNQASQDGGALYIDLGSDPRISACVFEANQATYAGGAARVLMSSPVFMSCTFRGNQAQYGGAMQYYECSGAMLANCLFNANTVTGSGGAVHNTNSSPLLINCTLVGNSAAGLGGGVLGWAPSMAVVANSILWGNSDSTGTGERAQVSPETAALSYSCVQNWTGSWPATRVSGADPLFVDADGADGLAGTEDDNFRLRAGSPYIDAGDNTVLPPDISDLDGDNNIAEPIALDILGYRRLEDAPLMVDTGVGTAPLVDLGPLEFVMVRPGDFDYDRDVDPTDLQHFLGCGLGPGIPQTGPACSDGDLDGDGDVDQADFALLQRSYGPLQ